MSEKAKTTYYLESTAYVFFLNTNQDPVLMHHKSILFFSLLAILEGLFVLMHNETALIPSHFKIEFVTLASQQNQNNQEWGR